MKNVYFLTLALAITFVGCTPKETPSPCDGNCHPSTATSVEGATTTLAAPATSGSAAANVQSSKETQSASVPTTSTSYSAGSVVLTASSSWEETVPPVSHVQLQLINKTQGLSFAVVSTTTKLSPKDYVQSGTSELQSLGMTTTTSTTSINGTSYTTLTSSSQTQSSVQWVHVDGTSVRVFACNGQKFDTSDLDACQAVMNTVRSR